MHALREVDATLPLTWLVVPCYHGHCATSVAMEDTLSSLLADGHELALHGYLHLDDGAPPHGMRQRFLRTMYTTGEGEFSAIGEQEALRRLDLGLDWFARRGWPVHGFVPPAWLMSDGARAALRQRPFRYTTSFGGFEVLPAGPRLQSPSLVYTARQRAGRWLSPRVASITAAALAHSPLVRFSLHPADAAHPSLVQHAQKLLERLLRDRDAMTKAQFAALYRTGAWPAASQAVQDG